MSVGRRAAAAVAGGTRIGAGRARADAQHAAFVDPHDRSAAGADRVDVEKRNADRQAVDMKFLGQLRHSTGHHAHVRGRAADVERDDVAVAGATRLAHGADHARGRTRQQGIYGVGAHGLRRQPPTIRLHD